MNLDNGETNKTQQNSFQRIIIDEKTKKPRPMAIQSTCETVIEKLNENKDRFNMDTNKLYETKLQDDTTSHSSTIEKLIDFIDSQSEDNKSLFRPNNTSSVEEINKLSSAKINSKNSNMLVTFLYELAKDTAEITVNYRGLNKKYMELQKAYHESEKENAEYIGEILKLQGTSLTNASGSPQVNSVSDNESVNTSASLQNIRDKATKAKETGVPLTAPSIAPSIASGDNDELESLRQFKVGIDNILPHLKSVEKFMKFNSWEENLEQNIKMDTYNIIEKKVFDTIETKEYNSIMKELTSKEFIAALPEKVSLSSIKNFKVEAEICYVLSKISTIKITELALNKKNFDTLYEKYKKRLPQSNIKINNFTNRVKSIVLKKKRESTTERQSLTPYDKFQSLEAVYLEFETATKK